MKCPICDKPVVWKDNPFRPFCSERCKLLDLGAWVDGEYAVPSDEPPPFEESPPSPLTSRDGAERPSDS
jgi:endogenous inhibitor of DNA gyrase (YacG/DUF329 family)